ncbi:MAG: 2'-5' RNA ligase family protein [Marinobacter sp.]|uniref:2'-5' RNA ligase family protein n=1 Tax=Marinobacter sp. TaxID=50741 RepID=UPI0032989890
MLYSLCYPSLSEADNEFIHSFRRQHDLPFLNLVEHHFTMAFGIAEIDRDLYIAHVRNQLAGQKKIQFHCRYAMLGNDDSDENYYVFLVPDEGYSDICLLHNRLYRGYLQPFHRVEIPYIPHIGLATVADAHKVKSLCDELNDNGLSIAGSIDALTICEFDGHRIADLEVVPLSD